jgi:hypothetical protein
MVDISGSDDEEEEENNTSVNEEGRSSTIDEVCTPISKHATEPEIANIPCDLLHDNVVEDDVNNTTDPQGHHAPGELIRLKCIYNF